MLVWNKHRCKSLKKKKKKDSKEDSIMLQRRKKTCLLIMIKDSSRSRISSELAVWHVRGLYYEKTVRLGPRSLWQATSAPFNSVSTCLCTCQLALCSACLFIRMAGYLAPCGQPSGNNSHPLLRLSSFFICILPCWQMKMRNCYPHHTLLIISNSMR